jgi:hypothetical protein
MTKNAKISSDGRGSMTDAEQASTLEPWGRCEGCGASLEEGDGLYCLGCEEAESETDDGPDCTR